MIEMPKELLEKYNHLKYDNASSANDDFIDFLFENTNIEAPDVNPNDAWIRFTNKLDQTKKKSYTWIRVAASVALLIGVGLFVWTLSITTEQLTVSSLDDRRNVTFPDGSMGVLNKNSTFSFPEKFGNKRLISFSGEAYFDIVKSNKPFIIQTGDVEVKVLGTSFNLINSKSNVELYVDHGLVAFETNNEQTKVPAGLKAVFDKKNGLIEITENPSPNIMSWRNGTFEFDDTPLNLALEELATYYSFEYKLLNDKVGDCRITATFEKRTLEEVISTIESILDVKISSKDNLLKLSGRGC